MILEFESHTQFLNLDAGRFLAKNSSASATHLRINFLVIKTAKNTLVIHVFQRRWLLVVPAVDSPFFLEQVIHHFFCFLHCSLPCLLCFICMRDTFVSEEKLKDASKLYAPGRVFHIVERENCRLRAKIPKIKTFLKLKKQNPCVLVWH